MLHVHQLASAWPEIFGVLALIANIVIAITITIKRDPKAQLPPTLTAVAVTLLAASTLFHSPIHQRLAATKPDTAFYPSATPPSPVIPAALQYRSL